jgi:hypothetical protein
MPKETLKNLKETNEGRKVKMRKTLNNKKRNHANSFGCNNSSAFNISRSKHKLSSGQKWNHPKK